MIIDTLQAEMGEEAGEIPVDIHTGVSYRHLLVLRGPVASPKIPCAPPHDHVGSRAEDLLPAAECGEAKATEKKIRSLMKKAEQILKAHPVNRKRISEGKDPANAIWPWSPGRKPKMRTRSTVATSEPMIRSSVVGANPSAAPRRPTRLAQVVAGFRHYAWPASD